MPFKPEPRARKMHQVHKKIALLFLPCLVIGLALSVFHLPVFAWGNGNGGKTSGGRSLSHVPEKKYVDGQIIVKYKDSGINLQTASGRSAGTRFAQSHALTEKGQLRRANLSLVGITGSTTVEDEIAKLKSDPNVEYAEPDYIRIPSTINTNDTYKGVLWGLDNTGQAVDDTSYNSYGIPGATFSGTAGDDIKAPAAWALSEATSSAPVIVAVIDTGIAYYHPDLAPNMWDGSNCVDESGHALGGCMHGYDEVHNTKTPLPMVDKYGDSAYHGTHVAGIIAAAMNNGKGVIGVAPHAKIMALTVYDLFSELSGIDFAIQNGAKIINFSFGGTAFSPPEQDAIKRFQDAGGIFITSAGNCGDGNYSLNGCTTQDQPLYPAALDLPAIVSVAATDQNDALASFSNHDPVSVDVGAPGMNIYSTSIGADFDLINEDFEGSTRSITFGGDTPSHWTIGPDGNSMVAFADNGLPPVHNASTWITADPIDLSTFSSAKLNFTVWCDTMPSMDTQGNQTLREWIVPMYYDGVSWGLIAHTPSAQYIDEDNISRNGGTARTVSGHAGYYKDYSLDITEYLSSHFQFRFKWGTGDHSAIDTHLGCSVDNIKITEPDNGLAEKYTYESGTSMSAPMVAGLAALVKAYDPSITAPQLKNLILTTGDTVSSLVGNTVTGKRINAYKALLAANPAKAISAFSIPNQRGSAMIDETAHTIAITMPFGSSVTALTPAITITGASVSPASGVAQDFTNPITYTVTALDGSIQTYAVTVTVPQADADIVAADKSALASTTLRGSNPDLSHITTALAALPASGTNGSTITWFSDTQNVVSNDGQTVVRPAFGVANSTVQLTGTLSKGSASDTKAFTLIVLAALNPAKAITTFSFASTSPIANGTISSTTIAVGVPYGTSITSLVPTVGITGVSVSPASGIAQNFTNPVAYIVTAADGTTQTYTVTVTVLPLSDASSVALDKTAVASTSLQGSNVDLLHVIGGLTTLPSSGAHGTSIAWSSDTPGVVSADGQTINRPAYGSSNATVHLTATITKGSATDTQTFTLVVLAALNPAKAITAFSFTSTSPISNGTISSTTIAVGVPYGTDVTALAPTITITGTSTSPASGVAQNFTNPVHYTVTAADGTTQVYTVTVTVLPLSDTGSVSLDKTTLANISIKGSNADLSHVISSLAAPPSSGAHGTSITWSSDAPGTVSADGQTINRPAYGSSNATVHLTATITKGSATDTQTFTLVVLAALNPAKAITAFSFTSPSAVGIISGTNIAVVVPYGTSITALTPTITITGASISPASGASQDFTNPVTYTVTAANGTNQTYTVTVSIADGSAKDLTSFNVSSLQAVGSISGTNITLNMPYGTSITALTPTITITGASISPASSASQDFTNPVTYTVTAQDSSTKVYTVTVVVALPADFTTLLAALVTARGDYANAVEGTSPGQYPPPLKANLQAAIDAATSTPGSAAQSGVDSAASTLNAAITVFNAGKVPPPSLVLLQNAIALAQSNASHAVAGALAGNYAQASIDTLNAAIAVAQGITSAIAQSVVDAATVTLNTAITVFQNSRVLATNQILLAPSTTLTASSSQAIVTSNNTATSTIVVPDSATNASLDISSLVQGTAAVLPGAITAQVSLPVGTVILQVPASTTIAASGAWSGTIDLPQTVAASSITPAPTTGNVATVTTAIEVGSSDVALTLDHSARIVLPGQAGKLAGYSRGSFSSQITTVCVADTQAVGDALAVGGDCAMSVGGDLVIWTKHFTTFFAYTQTAAPAPIASGGGGGGGMIVGLFGTVNDPSLLVPTTFGVPGTTNPFAATSTIASTSPTKLQSNSSARTPISSLNNRSASSTGPVFTQTLIVGSIGNDVTALQNLLTQDGFYGGPITGKIGALTYAAVRKYQYAHHLPLTGFTDAPTRDAINREIATTYTAPTALPTASSTPPFARTLIIGSIGDDVTALQNLLTQDGFYGGPITGKIGALTYAAVRKYQYAHHLPLTGYADSKTRDVLNQETLR